MKFFQPKTQVDIHVAADLELCRQAKLGNYKPLAHRLEELSGKELWYQRDYLLDEVTKEDVWDTDWMEKWLEAAPADPAPNIIRAKLLIAQAWEVRSGHVAAKVSEEQFFKFHGMLEKASDHIESSLNRFAYDPSVWVPVFHHAKGLQHGLDHEAHLVSHASDSLGDGFVWRSTVRDSWSVWWGGSAQLSWDFSVHSMEEYPDSMNMLLPLLSALRDMEREDTELNQQMVATSWTWALSYTKNAPTEFEQIAAANRIIAALAYVDEAERYAQPFFKVANGRIDSRCWNRFNGTPEAAFKDIYKRS